MCYDEQCSNAECDGTVKDITRHDDRKTRVYMCCKCGILEAIREGDGKLVFHAIVDTRLML